MRINRGLLNWGTFLIALGGVPLAVQQGWADESIAGDMWRVWPLILVGIGLGLILRWTPVAWLGGALVAGTFGLIFGALIAGGISGISSACVGSGSDGGVTSRSGIASSTSFSLDIEFSCGQLNVAREAGTNWSVEASHAGDNAPTIDGSISRLSIRQDFGGNEFLLPTQETQNEWLIGVPSTATLTLGMTLNAAEGRVDLGSGPFEAIQGTFNAADIEFDLADVTTDMARIGMTFNASAGRIFLPDASISGTVTLNASSLELCVPIEADIRIQHDGWFSSDDIDKAGLVQRDSGWQTEDYDTASTRIDLRIASNVSSVSLERKRVCP
jgi:hypothetical protein